jgi:hypothetical protein
VPAVEVQDGYAADCLILRSPLPSALRIQTASRMVRAILAPSGAQRALQIGPAFPIRRRPVLS